MRLWHVDLLPKLPKQWLMGQHRECCALRGKGWGRKHSTVNYVFKYSYISLYLYHRKVMEQLEKLNVKIDRKWFYSQYRGKNLGYAKSEDLPGNNILYTQPYPEHNDEYLEECIENLKRKGVII